MTRLNDDSSIKQLVLNVYHQADDSHTGVGRIRSDIRLTFEKKHQIDDEERLIKQKSIR